MKPVSTEECRDYEIRIYYDEFPLDPSKEFDYCDEGVYSAYLDGEVYGYEVYLGDRFIDSCWGFYGEPGYKFAVECAKDAIHSEIEHIKASKAKSEEMFSEPYPYC